MAKTWATLKLEIKNDMNLHGEDWVSDAELLAWANDGIEQAEKEIVSLYDKYLETDVDLALVSGQSLYSLPSDIMASKITNIDYTDGSLKYEIKYAKTKAELRYEYVNDNYYTYRLRNDSVNGRQIEIFPTPNETSPSNVKIDYIRRANRLVEDTDLIDIPDADAFIKQYIKDQVRGKELGPMWDHNETPSLSRQRALFIEVLNNMIPDETRGEMQMDTSHYDDVMDEYGY